MFCGWVVLYVFFQIKPDALGLHFKGLVFCFMLGYYFLFFPSLCILGQKVRISLNIKVLPDLNGDWKIDLESAWTVDFVELEFGESLWLSSQRSQMLRLLSYD